MENHHMVYEECAEIPESVMIQNQAKAARQALIDCLIVSVDGVEIDGDEKSQERMARAVVAMDDGDVTAWVGADNSLVQLSRAQLRSAMRQAGILMTGIWVAPYL